MPNDIELYNVHAESADTKKWSILNTKIYCVDYNRKELPLKRIKFSSTEGKCHKVYGQSQSEIQPCQRINFEKSMTEEPQADC